MHGEHRGWSGSWLGRPAVLGLASLILAAACTPAAPPPAPTAASAPTTAPAKPAATTAPAPTAAPASTTVPAAPGATTAPAAAASTAGIDRLYEAAKKEGAVVWQAGPLDQAADALAQGFMKRYPGIQVTFNPINEPQVAAQIITEAAAGSGQVRSLDVAHGSPTQFQPLLERDMMASADWSSLGVDPSRVMLDGKWVVNEDSVNVWIYNTTLVAKEDVPQTWEDLLKPRWKGKKIVTNVSASGFTHLFYVMGEDKASGYLSQLKNQDLVYTKSKGPAREMVTAGQAHLGIATVKDALLLQGKGAPIDIAPLNPMERDLRGWYLPKNVQHPNAAQLFVAWVTSPEGWAIQQQAAGLDIATPCEASAVAKMLCDRHIQFMDFNTVGKDIFEYYKQTDVYTDRARDLLEVGPA